MSAKDKSSKKFSRRKFLIRTFVGGTGALVLGTYLFRNPLRRQVYGMMDGGATPYMGNADDPDIWFEITQDNKVILSSPKVEMGQGTFTGLAQIAADELGVAMEQIEVKHAATLSGNIDGMSTGGSTGISSLWQPLRELSATMREMIKGQAAKKLGVDIASLSVAKGIVSGGGKEISYAQVVKDVTEWEVPDVPTLKPVKEYKYVGKPIKRVDLEAKVFGDPIFGMDAEMPDMLFGAVARSTKVGATFVDADTSEAEKMPGVVKVVKEADFVGVVAKSRMEAENAKKAIKTTWNTEKEWSSADIEDMIKVGKGEPMLIQTEGDPEGVLEGEEVITAEYTSPIGAHAQIEPNGAVAFVEEDKATVKLSTQVVGVTQKEVAERLGFKPEQVNVIPTFLGGGFGRRLHTPNAIQAAVLSKAVGKPVKCFFDRKEEFQNDTFRPPTHHLLKAKLTAEGMIEGIEHNVSSGDVALGSALFPAIAGTILGSDIGAWRGGTIQYTKIPNYQAISWRIKLPFATSWWRSLGLLSNTFAIEGFLDILSEKAGKDPVQFRLDHIADDEKGQRLRKVIETAAQKSGWSNAVPAGRALGFAASTDGGTPCAHVVELSIINNKQIRVHKVTCVMDPGMAVNPDQVKAQCEGAIIMGISASIYEQMNVKKGELRPVIYGPYQMATIKDAPKEINVTLIQSSEIPGAVGEPPLGPIGAAIANAVYKLTKKRQYAIPIKIG